MSNEEQEFTVRFFKLRNGEEFISLIDSVIEYDSAAMIYKCLEPCVIAINPDDKQQMAFHAWSMFSSNRLFDINSKDLLFEPKEVDEGIVNEYKRYFMDTIDPEEVEKETDSVILTPNFSEKMKSNLING